MMRRNSYKRPKIRAKAVISRGSVLFSKEDKVLKTLSLRHGLTLIDTEQKNHIEKWKHHSQYLVDRRLESTWCRWS